jgi:cell division protein FtsW
VNETQLPERTHKPDYSLAIAVVVLLAIGLVVMYSISPILSYKQLGNVDSNRFFGKQALVAASGLAAMVLMAYTRYDRWRLWGQWVLVAAAVMTIALLVPGLSQHTNGATRWLNLGPLSVQPAEVLKLGIVLYLAFWFERRRDELKSLADGVMPFLIMAGIIGFAVVVMQRDMGTMLVLGAVMLGMYFVAGMRRRHLLAVVATAVVAGWLAITMFPHRMERVMTFLNPRCDDPAYALNDSHHICQALLGVGSGGLFGVGLGHSIQVYGYLPEAANDSIFSVVAEEFGLVGATVIVALFVLVAWRALAIARRAPDTFGRLVATGIGLWIITQAVVNIGAMLALVPLTGIPLPFISFGGTNLLVSLMAVGILLNISKYTVREGSHESGLERRRIGRAYHAGASRQRRVAITR